MIDSTVGRPLEMLSWQGKPWYDRHATSRCGGPLYPPIKEGAIASFG